MAYDEGLAERLREMMPDPRDISEKKMFGGLCFLSHGHMTVGIVGDVLMARIGTQAYEAALRHKHVRKMDFTGKPMKGYIFVDPPGIADDDKLRHWLDLALAFVKTLPPK